MFHILHIDQSQEFNKVLTNNLSRSANLTWAQNLSNARKFINSEKIDLILLDLDLPDGNGIDFCYSLQGNQQKPPVIVLTSHDDISKKVLSFAAGADDYITRPCHMIELQAKLDSKLRNHSNEHKIKDILKWTELQITKSKQEVIVHNKIKDQKVELTSKEFKLLIFLSSSEGAVLSRDMILDHIWGRNVFVSHRSVDTHISKLRRKLGLAAHVIQSVHGTGYMFCPTNLA